MNAAAEGSQDKVVYNDLQLAAKILANGACK